MTAQQRLYEFTGNDAEYALFLEGKLKEGAQNRQSLPSIQTLLSPSTTLPAYNAHPNDHEASNTNGHTRVSPPKLPLLASSASRPLERIESSPSRLPRLSSSNIEFCHYDPFSRETNDVVKISGVFDDRWKREMTKFLSALKPDTWDSGGVKTIELLLEMSIDDPQIISPKEAILEFIGRLAVLMKRTKDPATLLTEVSESQEIQTARHYATFAQETGCQVTFTRLRDFEELIFVSLCIVAIESGISEGIINSKMKFCISDSRANNLYQRRLGASWVHNRISDLSKTAWGYRSTEIFLLYGQSLTFYQRYASVGEKSKSFFLFEMSKLKPKDLLSNEMPFSIPCIIYLRLKGLVNLEKICSALGYDHERTSECYKKFYKPYIRRKKRPLEILRNEPAINKRAYLNPTISSGHRVLDAGYESYRSFNNPGEGLFQGFYIDSDMIGFKDIGLLCFGFNADLDVDGLLYRSTQSTRPCSA